MILVTGGTGTVGRSLLAHLSEKGAKVRALVRDPGRASKQVLKGVEWCRGDLEKPETLPPALEGCDHVFLLSSPDPSQVAWQGNLIEAAKAAGTNPHFVKLSAIAAALDAPYRMGRWHAQTERHLEDAGLPWTHLRPAGFMQNFLMLAPVIAAEGILPQPTGDGKAAYIDARDVAEVASVVLLTPGHEGKIHTLTGPESLSGEEVVERLSSALQKTIRFANVPPAAARSTMIEAGMPEWLADGLLELYDTQRRGGLAETTSTVSEILGRPPRTLEAFAADHAEAFA